MKVKMLIFTILTLVVFWGCEFSLEPTEISVSSEPVELNWIYNSDRERYYYFTHEFSSEFEYGTACDKIFLHQDNGYFVYTIGDTSSMQELVYTPEHRWTWSEKSK